MQRRVNTFVKANTAVIRETYPRLAKRELWLGIFAAFFALFAVISPKSTKESVSETLSFFVNSVLPSMLPFMIASGLLTACGIGKICKKLFSPWFYRVFGISGALAPAFILGWLAGAPMGAKMICDQCRQGECNREEAEIALPLCSNPGLGFTALVVGGGIMGSVGKGLAAWLICGASSIITAIILKPKQISSRYGKSVCFSMSEQTKALSEANADKSVSRIITDTVTETSYALLKICGFIVFFKTAAVFFSEITASIPFLTLITPKKSITDLVKATVAAFMEFSTGAKIMSEALREVFVFSSPRLLSTLTVTTTAAILSWSGMSVHFQISSFASDTGLSMRRYYRAKAIAVAVTVLLTLAWSTLLPS